VAGVYQEDAVECLVTGQVFHDLTAMLAEHSETEWLGLLSGRVMEDSLGVYVVVTGAAMAEALDASRGHVRCSEAEFTEMVHRLNRKDPAGDLVGWWHSHLGSTGFSVTDLQEQSTWDNDHSIGLLATPGGPPDPRLVRVYRGPTARQMVFVGPRGSSEPRSEPTSLKALPTGAERLIPTTRAGAATTPTSKDAGRTDPSPSPPEPPGQTGRVRPSHATQVAAWIAIVLSSVAIGLALVAFSQSAADTPLIDPEVQPSDGADPQQGGAGNVEHEGSDPESGTDPPSPLESDPSAPDATLPTSTSAIPSSAPVGSGQGSVGWPPLSPAPDSRTGP
jgi:proteasome lid subunit RPN8/RPN11